MSEKQTNPEEKVTPEEYLESVSGHAGRCYPAATIVHYKNALKAVALARKEGEERIREGIQNAINNHIQNYEILVSRLTDHELWIIEGIQNIINRYFTESYLPEKGDNNGKE